MRLIGIATQYRMAEGLMAKRLWGVLQFYLEALASQGLAYVLLPPQGPSALEKILPHLDGLLLPGGGDVDPYRYGQEPHIKLGEVSPERDAHETFLARYAAEKGLPILGICRGIQVMNVALGGTLYQASRPKASARSSTTKKAHLPPWPTGWTSWPKAPFPASFLPASG